MLRALTGLLCAAAAAAAAWAAAAPRVPTFHGQVDRILRRHCDECHRAGDVGPQAFDTYAGAAPWAQGIVESIESGEMPPWRPTRGVGRFVGERGVSEAELDVLRRWRDAGAPEGTPPARPRPLSYPSGWALGTPDALLDYGEPFAVAAGGDDVYRCFPVRNPFGKDVWLSAIDVQPGDRRVVHHVVLYVDPSGSSAAKDAADAGPGYACFGGPATSQPMVLGGWAPGNRARRFPRGTATRLGANDTVVVQCHYHSHESTESVDDRTTVALYLSPDGDPQPIYLLPVLNDTFTIPAGDAAYPVEAVLDTASFGGGLLQVSGHVLSVLPHMHWLGKSIDVDLLLPDGTEQRLVEIRDWDFDWQATYTFRRGVPSPVGTKIRLRSVYDNSAANARNPNAPPLPVSWGERTTDEMCLAFLAVTLGPARAPAPPVVRSATVDATGRLVVAARGLGRGGRIEIDGVPLADSAVAGTNRLRSATDWSALAPAGTPVALRVRRTDGRLSQPFPLER